MARTLWLTLPIGASSWSVYLADADDPELADSAHGASASNPLEGCALRPSSIILINRALPADRRRGVLVHELLHAVFHMAGVKITDAREESLICAIEPALTHALVGARLLRLRRVPR